MGRAEQGSSWFHFGGVRPNPSEEDVREAFEAFRENSCDGVVGLGGGSALDVAKALRLLVKQPGLKLGEFDQSKDWRGLAPFIAIPTTAGTGSEVGRTAVIGVGDGNRKVGLFHPELLAGFVILDPELTVSLSPSLTAATGLDAMTHCIEAFTSPVYHPLCDGLAREGIRLIVEFLPRAFEDGEDVEARGNMLVAAAMGGIAFQKDLGAVHSLAHPLSTICSLHHGTANAVCLPFVMEFNSKRRPGIYRPIGVASGLDIVRCDPREADDATIAFVREFTRALGLDYGLRNYGVREAQIEALAEQAMADPCHRTNPVAVTVDDLGGLYRAAL